MSDGEDAVLAIDARLLACCISGEAIDELGHDLADRPDWARIPLHGILALL